MKLYHGSHYLTNILKPGFLHTGVLVEWDTTENNKWLYASTDKDEAILNGLASALGTICDIDRISWDAHVLTVTTAYPLTPSQVRGSGVYLYEFDINAGAFVRVNNQHNGSKTEYKTQQNIHVQTPAVVGDVLCNRKLIIKKTIPAVLSW